MTFPDGTQARYEYQPDGGRVVRYSNGVVTTENGAGGIVSQRLPDGTLLTSFDRAGRPTGGSTAGGRPLPAQQPVDAPAMPPGTRTAVDPGGPVVRQVTADGTVFDGFDGQGRPTSGAAPDGARFIVNYDAKSAPVQGPASSAAPAPASPGGLVMPPIAPDTAAPGAALPTSGSLPDGTRDTVTYDAKGDQFQPLPDGTAVAYSPTGQVTQQVRCRPPG